LADGGYPKTWRHYIETTTIIDTEMRQRLIADDIAAMGKQLVLSPPVREMIVGTSDKIRTYFKSLSLESPRGDDALRERALQSVDAMEASLVNAGKKEVGL